MPIPPLSPPPKKSPTNMNDNQPRDTTAPLLDEKKPLMERLKTSADATDNANYFRRKEDNRWGYSPEDRP